MAGVEFQTRPHVEQYDGVRLELASQLGGRHRLQPGAVAQVGFHQPLDLGVAAFRQIAQRQPGVQHLVARQPVAGIGALPANLHELGGAQDLQMLRCIGHRQRRLLRQLLDRPLPLGEKVEQLQPPRIAQRARDAGELLVQPVLEGALGCGLHGQLFNYYLE